MVPAEEVARLRYSPLSETVALFPSPLLDSALTKMRAAANDALVQRTLHPRRRVGHLDRRRLALGRRVPLELDRPRNRRRLPPLRASLARRGRIARVRLPFPHPPEAPEVKVKEPGKSRPDRRLSL